MKKILFNIGMLLVLFSPSLLWAQKQERQTGDTTRFRTLIPEEKQGLLKNVSMIANMNFAFRNEFEDGKYTQSRFKNEQFRLEIRGQVHEKVYFRFRDRYTRAQTSESIDNLSRSTDLAYIRVDATKKLSFSAGKMCADWGAFEFDYNPIDIYEYSDIIEYADNFLTGVGISYLYNPRHQF
jgi:Phosphate-selective porin O and P